MYKNFRFTATAACLLSVAALLTGKSTHAEPLRLSAIMTNPDGVRFQVLRFGDLNPASASGNERLYRRIQRSADLVCQSTRVTRPVFRAAIERCRRDAIARAVAEIGSEALTAHHRAHLQRRAARG
jgi:UrcA family protein